MVPKTSDHYLWIHSPFFTFWAI